MYDELQVKALERAIRSADMDFINGQITRDQHDALVESYERDIARIKRGE